MKNLKRFRLSPSMQIILGFTLLILIGTFILCLPISNSDGNWLSFIDSFFTSTSAVCVTGLIVVDTTMQFTLFGKFVILFLIQIGGLGIIATTSLIFLMLRKKISLNNRMALQESINKETIQGVVKFIKKTIIICLVNYESICVYAQLGINVFNRCLHIYIGFLVKFIRIIPT